MGKKAKIPHRVQCYFSGNFDGPPDSLLAIQISFLFFCVILHLFIAPKSIARIGIFLILFLAKIFCSALQLLILLLLLPMYLLSFKEVYVYVQTLPFLSIYFTAVLFCIISFSASLLCVYVCSLTLQKRFRCWFLCAVQWCCCFFFLRFIFCCCRRSGQRFL